MTHPKQNTQVIIKQQQNVASRSLDEQLTQAKQAFSSAKHRLVTPKKRKRKAALIPNSLAGRFSLLTPQPRSSFVITQRETGSDQVRRLQQCINYWKTSEALA